MHLKIHFLFWVAPIDDVDVGSQKGIVCCILDVLASCIIIV